MSTTIALFEECQRNRVALLIDFNHFDKSYSDEEVRKITSEEQRGYFHNLTFWWHDLTVLERASLLIANQNLLLSTEKQFSFLMNSISEEKIK